MNLEIMKVLVCEGDEVMATVEVFDEVAALIKVDGCHTLESWRELSEKVEQAIGLMNFEKQ